MPGKIIERFEVCKEFCKGFPDPVVITDPKGKILDVSGCSERLLGNQTAKMRGKLVYELSIFEKQDKQTIREAVQRAAKGEESEHANIEFREGKKIKTHTRLFVRSVKDGSDHILILVFRDVTSTKEAECQLEASEHRYRELFDNMQSGVAVYEAVDEGNDFIVKEFNKAALKSDRLTADRVIGKSVEDLFPGAEEIGFVDVLRRVWKTGTPEHFPPTMYHDDRLGKVWWEDYVYKLPSGEIIAAFANITNHMKALEKLQKSIEQVMEERNKIKTIVDSIADAVFVVDRKYQIVLFNEAASRVSGVAVEDAIGKPWNEVIHFRVEGTHADGGAFIKEAIEEGTVQKAEHELSLVDLGGDLIPVAHSVAPLRGNDGVRGAVIVLREMKNEREMDRAKTEFVTIASHQLHTPLMSMRWFLELLLRGKAGEMAPEQRKYIEQAYAGNERMISLVQDMLFVSRVGTGDRFAVAKEPVDIVMLMDQAIKDNVDLIQQNKISVVKQDDLPERLTMNVDREKILRVFYNLISNAVKYSKLHGNVEIGFDDSQPDTIVFFVRDNGYGIPQRQQYRVFERFFRADNIVTKVPEGTGLGLFIVKSIVEAHGGKMWFESIEDTGSTFYFSLPKTGSLVKKRKRNGAKRPSLRGMIFSKKAQDDAESEAS